MKKYFLVLTLMSIVFSNNAFAKKNQSYGCVEVVHPNVGPFNRVWKNTCGFGVALWSCEEERCGADGDGSYYTGLQHIGAYSDAPVLSWKGSGGGFYYAVCGAPGVDATRWHLVDPKVKDGDCGNDD